MNNAEKEAVIQSYFNMWVQQDFLALDSIFSSSIYYSECYGPEYHGLHEVYLWINDMLKKQKVLEWKIKRFMHENSTTVAEWLFKDMNTQNGEVHCFDGVSIIEFQPDGKISSIKEFESKFEHIKTYHV